MPLIRDRIIKGDSRFAVDVILESHEAYKFYVDRWRFLNDSYQGGYDYFIGRYLEPYYFESREDYEKRLRQVAVDNHVKSIVGIYNSFLFRKQPMRDYANIENDPSLESFLADADLDGRSYEAFMRDVSAYSMVYGHCWVIIDKPQSQALTRADELNQEIRPYVSLFTPENVLDWEYERLSNGVYKLTYLKVKEEVVGDKQYVREYTSEEVNVYELDGNEKKGELISTLPNSLGQVPAVCVYAQRSNLRGVGVSSIGDIADVQRELYELGSEAEQIIRITNHPSLVKSVDTEATAGAGSIIQLPPDLDPGLKPYLLQPNGASIESILNTVNHKIQSIDRMASLGGIRNVEARTLSGVALQTEFQLLNAKLSDFAMNLEVAEEQIWRVWCLYQDTTWNGEISYPKSFNIQDKANDIVMIKQAKEANITNPYMIEKLDRMLFQTITEKDWDEIDELVGPMKTYQDAPTMDPLQHAPVTSPEDLVMHLREMVEQGYTNEQIIQLHPELAELFDEEDSEDDGTV